MEIVFIGAGNLATNLAFALKEKGYTIKQVYSRTEQSAKELADGLSAGFTNDIKNIETAADLYFVALKDDVIGEVVNQLTFQPKLIVHTAGSIPMSLLTDVFDNCGVLYPVQTFSKHRKVDLQKIPLCLEANSDENYEILKSLAMDLSDNIHSLTSEQRLYLHVGAVFACNFSNFMCVGAETILEKHDIPFHILKPLIKETFDKIEQDSPSNGQTGPALRNDRKTMEKHQKILSDSGLFQNLYRFVSDAIINFYKKNKRRND